MTTLDRGRSKFKPPGRCKAIASSPPAPLACLMPPHVSLISLFLFRLSSCAASGTA
ncbi:hypothetical protein BJV78DRAFT_1271401 [Lactifluus subvellereus]|nr:hypothetical protein BJV78DRAFT_1271401 [Lactifluus subvellereus]